MGGTVELAFQTLNSRICSAPILHFPDLNKTFMLRTDASDTGLGAVLLQEFDNELFRIVYASQKLLQRSRAYSTIKREWCGL